MKTKAYLIAATFLAFNCGSASASKMTASGYSEFLDGSLMKAQIDCQKSHALVGRTFELVSRAHEVSGTVRLLDDCTLLISNFNFDGKGRLVEVYVGQDGDFAQGSSISKDLYRPTQAYESAELLIRLPQGQTFDDFNSLSIWCTEVGVSFGDVVFIK
jgi:hypothetical protein